MADSWTKLYTVCAEAIKPYCLTEFSLRWRCRCVHEMYGENAQREKRVSTRSAKRSIQHLSPLFPSITPTRAEGVRQLEPKTALWVG